MSKCFIVATSYYAHTVMFLSDYVFSNNEYEFILLKENHRISDFANEKVTLCDSIQTAVENCDFVWFIDSKLYHGIYGKVAVLANKNKKKLILSELDLNKKNHVDISQKELFRSKPTILSIGIGDGSQQYCTEIFLNKMLRQLEIDFDQFFSPTSKSILENLSKGKLVNKEIVKQIFNPKYNGSVCIKGITLQTLSDLTLNIHELMSWKPDVIIINVNQTIARNKEMIKSISSFFHGPMFLLCSQYEEIENNIPRTFFIRTNNNYNIPMIEDENARCELEKNIVSELSYPRHARKII